MNIIDNISYEEYLNALKNKEILRKQLMEVKIQMEFNKKDNEVIEKLLEREKEIKQLIKHDLLIIKMYENNIERGFEK